MEHPQMDGVSVSYGTSSRDLPRLHLLSAKRREREEENIWINIAGIFSNFFDENSTHRLNKFNKLKHKKHEEN